jgi:UDP:flavonoid glycosyltransferase YjiC (YdhE family)
LDGVEVMDESTVVVVSEVTVPEVVLRLDELVVEEVKGLDVEVVVLMESVVD